MTRFVPSACVSRENDPQITQISQIFWAHCYGYTFHLNTAVHGSKQILSDSAGDIIYVKIYVKIAPA
jgi:hypothetical protein